MMVMVVELKNYTLEQVQLIIHQVLIQLNFVPMVNVPMKKNMKYQLLVNTIFGLKTMLVISQLILKIKYQ